MSMVRRSLRGVCGLALVLLGAAHLSVATARAIEPGSVAPVSARGSGLSISDYKGEVVLLDFWASWCATCKLSLPFLDRMQRTYGPRGLRVIAVNVDEDRSDAERLLKPLAPQFSVVFDPKGELPAEYKISSMPTSYLIDRRGTVREKHEGFRQSSEHEIEDQIRRLLGEGEASRT